MKPLCTPQSSEPKAREIGVLWTEENFYGRVYKENIIRQNIHEEQHRLWGKAVIRCLWRKIGEHIKAGEQKLCPLFVTFRGAGVRSPFFWKPEEKVPKGNCHAAGYYPYCPVRCDDLPVPV